MAPSGGHLLVPKIVKAAKFAVSKTAALVRSRLPQTANHSAAGLETVPVRLTRHPLHPLAAIRQNRSQSRQFSTAARRFLFGSSKPNLAARRPLPTSAVRTALSKSSFAPFASPLRPNLTGGTLPRASGGYSYGGSARHFSHTSTAQAQVVQNVSAAIRAFYVNGYKARYDGIDPHTGEKRYRAVTKVQEDASKRFQNAADQPNLRGTTLEFRLAPTITAVSPLESSEITLGTPKLLSSLATDFSRSLATLSLVHADLTRLSALGSLPILHPDPSTLHVRFPGCDGSIASALCDELGIQRGIVREDDGWAEDGDKDVGMALLFPCAPSGAASATPNTSQSFEKTLGKGFAAESLEWQSMLSHNKSQPSVKGRESPASYFLVDNPWRSAMASYDGLRDSDLDSNDNFGFEMERIRAMRPEPLRGQSPSLYEGIEGIHRFIAECEAAER